MPGATMRNLAREEGFVEARDGTELFYREWYPEDGDVTALVLFIHGIGLHSDSPPYGEKVLIPKLLERGTAFHSIDLRGHGRSGGSVDRIVTSGASSFRSTRNGSRAAQSGRWSLLR